MPDLYSASARGGSRNHQVRIQPIPLSSRSKRTSFETLPTTTDADQDDLEAYEISTDVHHTTLIQIPSPARVPIIRINKSHETLSNIVRNEVGLSNSMRDLQKAGSNTKRKKIPPIRQSKGVMQVLSENVGTRIPRRQSVSESSNRTPFSRTQARASRRGSVAPVEEIRSKTPTPRRQSVSRPTTLSPIIGTPNRDSELSAASKSSERDLIVPDSPSRIPIRSRSGSRAQSQHREGGSPRKSPQKDRSTPPPTTQTSILRKTPISVTSNLHRANANKKNIPVFGSMRKGRTKVGIAHKIPPKMTGLEKKNVKRNSSLKSESSAEEPKDRVPSRQPSPDKKSPSPPVKRGPSPAHRSPSPAKREPSPVKNDSPQDRKMKRLLSKDSFQSKSSDSIRKKVLEKKNSFKKQQSNPDLIKLGQKKSEEDHGSINSVASAASIRGVTRAGEKFKKLVPLTKQNIVSMTTAAVVSQPAQIQTTLANQLSNSKLVDAKRSSDDSNTTDPASIIEHSQKALESIQKTMSEATDEINKTIEENLSHLKEMVSDSPKPTDKMDKKHPAMLSRDSKPNSSRDLLKKRMESGTPKGTPKNMPKTPTTAMPPPPTPKPTVPVEPTVNVIEKPMEPKATAAPAMPKPDPIAPVKANDQAPARKLEGELESGKSDRPMMNSGGVGGGTASTQQPPPAHNQKSSTTTEESKQHTASGVQKEAVSMGGKSLAVGQSGAQTQPPMMTSTTGRTNNNNSSSNANGKGGGSASVVAAAGSSTGASSLVPGQTMSKGGAQQQQPQG